MWLSELTLQSIAFRVLALLIIAGVHGGIVAAAAVFLGDKGPKYDGRLTAAPFGHLDILGGACLILFGLGWTKPVAVDAGHFRTGRAGLVLVVLAAFAALLATAALLLLLVLPALTVLPYTAGLTTAAFLRVAAQLCIWFALFNLLPVPPLTGGHLLAAIKVRVPHRVVWILAAGLVAGAATGIIRRLLAPAYALLAPLISGGTLSA